MAWPPYRRSSFFLGSSLGKLSDPIQQNPCCSAIVLIVIEDALLDRWITRSYPLVKPFNRRRTGWISITPLEPQIFGQRLDRMIPCRPHRRLLDNIVIEVN